jgi:hypothetical protein
LYHLAYLEHHLWYLEHHLEYLRQLKECNLDKIPYIIVTITNEKQKDGSVKTVDTNSPAEKGKKPSKGEYVTDKQNPMILYNDVTKKLVSALRSCCNKMRKVDQSYSIKA